MEYQITSLMRLKIITNKMYFTILRSNPFYSHKYIIPDIIIIFLINFTSKNANLLNDINQIIILSIK